MAKKGLGRGLEALLADNDIETSASSSGTVTLKISDIEPNREQARKHFDESALLELSDSISRHGLIQPITVRKKENGYYEIIAGERRWRASKIAGLSEIPVIIRESDDVTASELSLIENLQREDLNAVEEACGYRDLMERFGLTQEEAAERVGKSRASVANVLRLLKLPESVLALIRGGELSYGHARALIPLVTILGEEALLVKANYVISQGLSVRQTEQLVKNLANPGKKHEPENIVSRAYYKKLETEMSDILGRKAVIKRKSDGKGSVSISFSSSEDLERLIISLCGKDFFQEDK